MRTTLRSRRAAVVAMVLMTFGAAGCGQRLYPVHGSVALDDGTPVDRGMVIFERVEGGEPVTAQGGIQPDGTYQLGTTKPGDGVPPGKYKVLLNSMDLSDLPDDQKDLAYDAKYLNIKTSGLEFEVRRSDNDIPIRLTRSAKKAKR
ncbi:MAG TPA: hypothetical protein VKE40_27260 [Gemmataceae bacterium]|nr:hypothetical protein [Gemmataceae bacterium]